MKPLATTPAAPRLSPPIAPGVPHRCDNSPAVPREARSAAPRRLFSSWLLVLAVVVTGTSANLAFAADPPPSDEHFETQIRPLLARRCQGCHGHEKQQGGLRLDTREGLKKGGDGGPVLEPEKLADSRLLAVLTHEGELKMPPKEPLPAAELALLKEWILQGAPFPADSAPTLVAPASAQGIAAQQTQHWSLRPITQPPLPPATHPAWEQSPVDRFLSARLASAGLAPSPRVDRRTWLRRVTFDLLGLPPTPAEVAEFLQDPAPDAEAEARVVDRLLAAPQYGERWGRHWLDVARYADTKGYVFTEERKYPFSYTYRDYVIAAFNADLPYNRFVQEQLAADLLDRGGDPKPLAALGFLTLGRRFGNNQLDIIDDRIDVVTRGLMALTVTCARCHDHKYDGIPTADYYALGGVFASSTEPGDLPLIGDPQQGAAYQEFLRELEVRERAHTAYVEQQQAATLAQLRRQTPGYLIAAATDKSAEFLQKIGLSFGPDDLRPAIITRWKGYITGTAREHHPVFAPWTALAALPADQFAPQAAEKLAALARDPAEGEPRINMLVRQKLAGLKPESLADVAKAYGELFATVVKQWEELTTPKPDAPAPAPSPTALPDPAAEELRQVVFIPEGPLGLPPDELRRLFNRDVRNKSSELKKQVDSWKATSPAAPPRAMALNDLPQPVDGQILVRGNPGRPGDKVPRRFLALLSPGEAPPFQRGSGRAELAEAITSPSNPLTSRVLINRVWMHHFGQPLVATPGDFGSRGLAPSHPELLDWLASRFMAEGWSLKWLHRQIVLSAAYAQVSTSRSEGEALDPENRLVWRMNRRRLEFEALRDNLLAVTGRLDHSMTGRAVDLFTQPFTPRRTVYGFIDRQDLPGTFRTFDFASPDVSTPQRPTTTVPQQALYTLNSPFVLELAQGAARQWLATLPGGTLPTDPAASAALVTNLYNQFLSRAPQSLEISEAAEFLATAEGDPLQKLEQLTQALLLSNEFQFID